MLFTIAWMQILVDLEPVELKLVPKLSTSLVHHISNMLVAVFVLTSILMLLLFIKVIGRLAFPKLIDFSNFDSA